MGELADAAQQTLTLPHAALRPRAPARLNAVHARGDVTISWVRCARIGSDSWGANKPPLGAQSEAYLLGIVEGGGLVKRRLTLGSPYYLYTVAGQTADFGAPPASFRNRIAQADAGAVSGLKTELTITL
jgi:hypothetical protein